MGEGHGNARWRNEATETPLAQAGGTVAWRGALGRCRRHLVAPCACERLQLRRQVAGRRLRRLDLAGLDLVLPVAQASLEAPVVVVTVVDISRTQRTPRNSQRRRVSEAGSVAMSSYLTVRPSYFA